MSQSTVTPENPSTTSAHANSHRSGDINDIDKDIEIKTQIMLQDPENIYSLGFLAESYYRRFKQRRAPSDLDHCIEYFTLALPYAPSGHPDLYGILNSLGICHHQRFHLIGGLDDIDKDIVYKTRAISMDDTDPALSIGLGRSYQIRFQRSGDLTDLEKSIEYSTQAVSITAINDLNLPGRLDSLANAHLLRFQRIDDPSNLDKAIECQTRATSLTPQGHRYFSGRLNNLSSSFNMRYNRYGDANDLTKSIEYGVHALSLADDSSLQFTVLTNLSILQLLTFQLLRSPDEIEKGIEYSACAFSLAMSGDHPDETLRLKHLGELYYARFALLNDLIDLDSAIESVSRAISLIFNGDEDLGDLLDHLGCYVHARWYLLHNMEDLENGIKFKSRAIALTPENHLSRARRLDNLGRSYLCKSLLDYAHNQQALRLALDCFRQASCAAAVLPLIKFTSACIWARSSQILALNESLEAYETAIDLIPHVIWLGTTVAQRYQALRELSNLAEEAASVAIKAQDYNRAVEWIEQGQSIVMNQSMMLRSPLDDLRSVEPMLADKLQEVAAELQTVSSREPTHYHMLLSDISLNNPEKLADRHRQLAKEHANLISQVRRLPGFDRFLRPKQASELVSGARKGPVVIINIYMPSNPRGVTKHSCDALILQPGKTEIAHLSLPKFDSRTSTEILSQFDSSILRGNPIERGVRRLTTNNTLDLGSILAALWRDIVKPVIDFLGYKPNQHLDDLPHITWCTVGALSFLPLHAAGTYGASKSCVSDYAISSYTPSLSALLSSSAPSISASILAVSQEQTTGSHSGLPGAARELEYIKEHARDAMSYTQLRNGQASVEAVLDAMERHDCIHFACHAHQSISDPTKSGFFLHDGTLNLVSIMRRSFKNKGLAFLSACQTAMGDRNLPNETAHLASSILAAGYPSVIATMWSIWDKDAPFLSDKVYGVLLKNGRLDCREAAKALHFAVAELRKEIGDDKFTRWVPFIHMGV